MKIELTKLNRSKHELKITRGDGTSESTILDTNTYLLHDICHFFVEKELNTADGFWGMLSRGYQIEQLAGKKNPLTEKLRRIECIAGGTQSVYSNHMDENGFWDYMQTVNHRPADGQFLKKVLPRIGEFMDRWNCLPIGQTVTVTFE